MPSMGPPPFGDGNLGLPWPSAWGTPAFNGATAFRRWKPLGGGCLCLRVSQPSMGPPPFGDGNLRGRVRPDRDVHPSMGPPPFGDGNGDYLASHRRGGNPSMGPPPFGDGNGDLPQIAICIAVPSMGPPPFGDGNWAVVTSAGSILATLQWGHRLSAMETCRWWRPGTR